MKKLAIAIVMLLWAPAVRADAMLTGQGAPRFPTDVDIDVSVRAQIESTTIVMTFAELTAAGDYSLTVPSPAGASPIGVDIDRGAGFIALPTVVGAPSAGGGGAQGIDAWLGTTPLVATLEQQAIGPLTVRVRFVRLLRRLGGHVSFEIGARRCPSRPATDAGPRTSVELVVETARDLAQFSATGAIVEAGVRGGRAYTGVTNGDVIIDVSYAEIATGIGVQLVTHRTPTSDPMGGDAGYFMLLVDADPAPSTMPRAISLVVDHSGSMSGDKIAQARDAARAMLDYLRPDDAFTIHQFDDGVDSWRSSPVAATAANIDDARDYIKGIDADGSTDLNEGIQAGLEGPSDRERFDALVLLSDGQATAGETDNKQILANAWRAAGDTRIFTFTVGNDADFSLMEALARGSRGRNIDLNDAQATRDLVDRARELFEDIRDVRLTDLQFALDGVAAFEMLPEAAPDLFSGGQVIIVGRYATPGTAQVHITGFEGEQAFDQTFVFDAPALAENHDIIKYVWATEKTRMLMGKIADGGDAAALQTEIETIGVAYRIQTPFTQFSGGSSDATGCSIGGASSMWLLVLTVGLVRRRRRR